MIRIVLAAICFAAISPAYAVERTLTLLDVYQQALARDPVLASALNQNRAAQELIEQGKALYRPSVSLSAGANATRSDIRFINSTGANNPFRFQGRNAYEGYTYGLDARQPIFDKESLVQIDQAETQVSLADKQLNLTQQDLILRVTQAYFDVLLAQDQIDLIAAQKATITRQREQAQATFDVGNATITDVNEAQARYDLIVAQEIAAVNAFQIAKRAVQAITGTIPEKLATVRADLRTNPIEQPMETWLDVTSKNNLNIQIQQDSLKLAEQEIEFQRAGHYPTLDAIASYTDNYANSNPTGNGSQLKTGVIGLQVQIPLYLGGAVSSRVRQATWNREKALEDVEVARRQTELETQRAYLNLNTSIAQVKALEQALVSSQSQVDSTRLGYEVGVRNSVDVLNAEQQLFTAKRDLLQARYNYLVNIIRLKAASGIVAEPDLADINQQLLTSMAP
jgi:outer membrane protein